MNASTADTSPLQQVAQLPAEAASPVDDRNLPPQVAQQADVPAEIVRLPIGRRVAYLRTQRGMTQRMFADFLGMSKSWVDKVEHGKRGLENLTRIYAVAAVLQVDVQLLIARDQTTNSGSSR